MTCCIARLHDALRKTPQNPPLNMQGTSSTLGYLWFMGRNDAMIKCSGFRLSPTEVADALCRMDGIREAVTFDLWAEELGQVVHVMVTCAPGHSSEASLIMKFCRDTMTHCMIPQRVYIWAGEMPHTSSGKIDRCAVIGYFSSLH
jgi:acyl-coenzyme A synthetase/AMP-(fatty) acid ligase